MSALKRFDIVAGDGSVEHVTDVGVIPQSCTAMTQDRRADGALDLNRNWKSFAASQSSGAEYVLRWMPTRHPSMETSSSPPTNSHGIGQQQVAITEEAGVVYNRSPPTGRISSDWDVKHMVVSGADKQ